MGLPAHMRGSLSSRMSAIFQSRQLGQKLPAAGGLIHPLDHLGGGRLARIAHRRLVLLVLLALLSPALGAVLGDGRRAGSDRPGSSRTEDLALDYITDGPAIVAAFQQAYGIDLTRARLHWWRFKALMSNLPEETQLVKIIGFRTADLTQFQGAERERRAELKERFALPAALRKGGGRIVTLQDRNEAFAARFRR